MRSVRRLTACWLRWIAGALLSAGMVLGAMIAPTPTTKATAVSLRTPNHVRCTPLWLFRRNVSAATVVCLGIATAAMMTVVSLVMIGMVIGSSILGLSAGGVPAVVLVAGILPHGIFEIAGFIWAGGAGLGGARVAREMFSRDSNSGMEIRDELASAGRAYGIAVVSIAIGALVECYVTPVVFGYAVEYAGMNYVGMFRHVS